MNLANDLALYELPSRSVVISWSDLYTIPVEDPEFFFIFSFSLIADVSYVW